MDLTNSADILSLFESDDALQLLAGAVVNRMRELLDEHDPNALHFAQPFIAMEDMLGSAAAGDTTMIETATTLIGEGGLRRLVEITVTMNED